jgi:hypothetical protein
VGYWTFSEWFGQKLAFILYLKGFTNKIYTFVKPSKMVHTAKSLLQEITRTWDHPAEYELHDSLGCRKNVRLELM